MLFKVISLFLVFMMVLAIFGRVKFPGQQRLKAMKCPNCGRYKIGKGACACKKGKP